MKKILVLFVFILSFYASQNAKGQYALKKGDAEYNLFNYDLAANYYLKAYKKKKTFRAIFGLANSTFLNGDYEGSEEWHKLLVEYPECTLDMKLQYAEVLKKNGKYAEAKKNYLKYVNLNKGSITEQQQILWLSSCENSLYWLDNPNKAQVSNAGNFNTKYSEWGFVKSDIGSFFSSNRPNIDNIKTDGFLSFDPVFSSSYKKANKYNIFQGSLGGAENLSRLNIDFDLGFKYQMGTICLNKSADELFFTTMEIHKLVLKNNKTVQKPRVQIFSSKLQGGRWSTPVPFFLNNPKEYSVAEPFINSEGNKLYFISDMPGGMGGSDIYVCDLDERGNWSEPLNLKEINTSGEERTPFLDENGNLFFSSTGFVGMGGLDIFVAKRQGNRFSKPYNLGSPLNSPLDDLSFALSGKNSGTIASNRKGGKGDDDIYNFKNLDISQLPDRNSSDYLVKLNPISNQNIEAKSDLANQQGGYNKQGYNLQGYNQQGYNLLGYNQQGYNQQGYNQQGYNQQGYNQQGEYNKQGGYNQSGGYSKQGYNLQGYDRQGYNQLGYNMQGYNMQGYNQEGYNQQGYNKQGGYDKQGGYGKPGGYNQQASSKKVITKKVLIPELYNYSNEEGLSFKADGTEGTSKKAIKVTGYNDIYFAFDSDQLSNLATETLDEFIEYLKLNKYNIIEIKSFSDSRGDDNYNLILSMKRAESVKYYMLKNGIESSRIISKGYGSAYPLNKCAKGVYCTEAQHQINRRIEFQIIRN
ncbi:MAG: OmpA family protein [Sphingobacteriaceae bacterium]|nr:OmpA family protein [Sphingobacteriaceae bacterium]